MAFPIRGLPDDVADKLDQAATQRGLSRNAYVVEILTEHVREARPAVTAEQFSVALGLASDLGDEELMRAAWS
jgi:plasmid stability protein